MNNKQPKQQTAMQALVELLKVNDIYKECMPYIIEIIDEVYLPMEKEQLENAMPQIISNCVIKKISDNNIDKASKKVGYVHRDNIIAFQTGAKWYREQLKKLQ